MMLASKNSVSPCSIKRNTSIYLQWQSGYIVSQIIRRNDGIAC